MFGKYMKSQIQIAVAALACAIAPVTLSGDHLVQETSTVPDRAALLKMAGRFAPVEIAADLSKLSDGDRQALTRLIEAARLVDALFLRQVWAGNDALLQQLARQAGGPGDTSESNLRLHYFLINKGPWSRLDHNRAFIAGVPAKPEGGSFYPPD